MPRKNDPPIIDVDDNSEELERENLRLTDELADARAQLDAAHAKLDDAACLADEVVSLKQGRGEILSIGTYLIILAVVIAGRMVIYAYIEKWGQVAQSVGLGMTVLFGAGALAALYKWLVEGWKAIAYHMIPKCVIVVTASLFASSIFSNGGVWEGTLEDPEGHPVRAVIYIVLALLFAASPASEVGIGSLQGFLDHPVMTVKKVMHI